MILALTLQWLVVTTPAPGYELKPLEFASQRACKQAVRYLRLTYPQYKHRCVNKEEYNAADGAG